MAATRRKYSPQFKSKAALAGEIGHLKMEAGLAHKNQDLTLEGKRDAIDSDHLHLSIRRQCELLGLNRSSYYYASTPCGESSENLVLMNLIDAQDLRTSFYGSRRMAAWFCRRGPF